MIAHRLTVDKVRRFVGSSLFMLDDDSRARIVKGADVDDDTLLITMGLGLLALWLYLTPAADAQPIPQPAPGVDWTPDPPASPVPVPMPAPSDAPNPPAATSDGADAIDLASAEFVGSPDVRGWPIRATLTIASLAPITPVGAPDYWPDVIPPGFDGPIQFTVWAFAPIGGRWIGSAFIEMWRGRPNCGADPFGGNAALQLANNWWYRTPGMAGYVPPSGSQVAFMITAGDARDGKGPWPVMERSQVVLVTLP